MTRPRDPARCRCRIRHMSPRGAAARATLLAAVDLHPGVPVSAIAALAGLHHTTARHHLERLAALGRLDLDDRGRPYPPGHLEAKRRRDELRASLEHALERALEMTRAARSLEAAAWTGLANDVARDLAEGRP